MKGIKDRIFRDIWTLFETKKRGKNKERNQSKKESNERVIKGYFVRDVKTLFQEDEEHYYEPKRVTNFSSYNYIEYEINGDKNRNLSLDECFNETEPYLRNTIIDLQNSDT